MKILLASGEFDETMIRPVLKECFFDELRQSYQHIVEDMDQVANMLFAA
jgi:hypothetical protein